ncbi:dual specificity protein phosphatase 15 isoform X4 [Manis javanica]|uniref:dual specificity protein phosphatase 15 isoform X4 n=1 Tax=Manis javanica TaxID=9974 RepID=UPI00187ACC08|nr:dual specificity protein phosphatase 15 isoform X4 [Manis javanica]
MTEGVGGACGGGSTVISLTGRGPLAAAAAGQAWAGPRTPGPLFPARLQAPGPGCQRSGDPSALRAASWGYFLDSTLETSLMPKTQISWAGIRSHTSSPSMSHPSLCCSKKHFKECINFIHCCRLNGGNCLVHWQREQHGQRPENVGRQVLAGSLWLELRRQSFAGISRSTTIVTAYVMTVTGLGWRDVLEAIKATRPIANPNPGFRQQLEEFGWGSSRKLRRQLVERFGEIPFRDEDEVRALLPLSKRCRQSPSTPAASPAPHSSASEGTLQRLVPRAARDAHRPLPLLARVKQAFSCLPRCLTLKGGK